MQVSSLPSDTDNLILYNFCSIVRIVAENTPLSSTQELTTTPEELIAGNTLLQSLTHYFPRTQFPPSPA